jgi:hypothetical protein
LPGRQLTPEEQDSVADVSRCKLLHRGGDGERRPNPTAEGVRAEQRRERLASDAEGHTLTDPVDAVERWRRDLETERADDAREQIRSRPVSWAADAPAFDVPT